MPYRDEHEALLSKVELLEAELERERARAEWLAASADRADALEETLDHVEAQLCMLRGETPRRKPGFALALALAMSAVVAMSVFGMRNARPPGVVYLPPPAMYVRPVMPRATVDRGGEVFTPIAYRLRAQNVVGSAPVFEGELCDVLIAPSQTTPRCRVTVSCGDEVVFGGEGLGYLDCAIVGGRPTEGVDTVGLADEGDPMLDMNLPDGRIVISNDLPETWSFKLSVPPPSGTSLGVLGSANALPAIGAPTEPRGAEAKD